MKHLPETPISQDEWSERHNRQTREFTHRETNLWNLKIKLFAKISPKIAFLAVTPRADVGKVVKLCGCENINAGVQAIRVPTPARTDRNILASVGAVPVARTDKRCPFAHVKTQCAHSMATKLCFRMRTAPEDCRTVTACL